MKTLSEVSIQPWMLSQTVQFPTPLVARGLSRRFGMIYVAVETDYSKPQWETRQVYLVSPGMAIPEGEHHFLGRTEDSETGLAHYIYVQQLPEDGQSCQC